MLKLWFSLLILVVLIVFYTVWDKYAESKASTILLNEGKTDKSSRAKLWEKVMLALAICSFLIVGILALGIHKTITKNNFFDVPDYYGRDHYNKALDASKP